jgi:UDP-glucose 4-epimerase
MKILVTGGCGFIGSHIADAYIRQGHEVSIIDDLSTGDIANLNPKAKFYEMDINSDLQDIFDKGRFEVINHHAAQINVRTSVDDPMFDARVNVLGTLNLLRLAVKHGVKRFIYASSGGAIYGEPEDLPADEDTPLTPLSPYGVSKVAAEKYILTYAHLFALDGFILRYSNVFGPRQIARSEAGVISIFIEHILKNEPCIIYGDGDQTRDYVFVSDVVEANLLALKSTPSIVNIGTGIETSVNDLIDVFSSILGRETEHRHVDPRPGEVRRSVLDYQKASAEIGWQPAVALKDGIIRTLEHFQKISQS